MKADWRSARTIVSFYEIISLSEAKAAFMNGEFKVSPIRVSTVLTSLG